MYTLPLYSPAANVAHCVSVCTPGGNYKKRQEGQKSPKLGAALQRASDYVEATRTPRERREAIKAVLYKQMIKATERGGREAPTVNEPLLPPSALLSPCSHHQHGKKGSFLLLFKTVMLILLLKSKTTASSSFSRPLPQSSQRTRQSTRSEKCQGEAAVRYPGEEMG